MIRLRPAALAVLLAFAVPAAAAPKSPSRSATHAARRATAHARRDTAQVLVRVGGQAITSADVNAQLQLIPEQARSSYSTPEARQQLIARMVEERIWLMTAMKHGVAQRPTVQQQLEQQRKDLLIRTYLQEVMAGNPAPTDSQAHAYYDAHLSEYKTPATVTLRHIQVRSEADGRNVLKLAQARGAEWDKLVQRFSTDSTTRANGGLLGTVTHDGYFPGLGRSQALADAAFAQKPGTIGGPVKTDKGWSVIKVDDAKPEGVRPFESMRTLILRQLSNQQAQEFYKKQLDEARRGLGVTPDSAAIKAFVSQRKSARDMFKDAQALASPQERIAAYQHLLEEYPDSDVSAQAQFMVGFTQSEELKNYDEAEKAFRKVLTRYPRSELAASARWMVDHMRTEDAPAFHADADSAASPKTARSAKQEPTGKP